MQLVLGLNALFITNLKVARSLPKAVCYVFVRQSIDPLSCCLSRYTYSSHDLSSIRFSDCS